METNRTSDAFEEIADLFEKTSVCLKDVPDYVRNAATDIHIAVGQPVIIYCYGMNRYTVSTCGIITKKQLEDIVYLFCDYSIYKHTEEIKSGFISILDKYRCGICGTCVRQNDGMSTVRNITSINIRIPHIIGGCADELIKQKHIIYNGILLVGEPASGKTTILADLVRSSWDKRITVIDERCEFSAFGLSDIADVMSGYKKSEGIVQSIRAMSPQLLVCDEIDSEDISAVKSAVSTGVSVLASIHGKIVEGQRLRPLIKEVVDTGAFNTIVELKGRLHPGSINKIYSIGEFYEACRSSSDNL